MNDFTVLCNCTIIFFFVFNHRRYVERREKCPEYPLNVSFLLLLQGANASALEKEIGPEQFPVNEHYFGLVNVSVSQETHTSAPQLV